MEHQRKTYYINCAGWFPVCRNAFCLLLNDLMEFYEVKKEHSEQIGELIFEDYFYILDCEGNKRTFLKIRTEEE